MKGTFIESLEYGTYTYIYMEHWYTRIHNPAAGHTFVPGGALSGGVELVTHWLYLSVLVLSRSRGDTVANTCKEI